MTDYRAYYNEIDPKAAAWLRELIARGLIARGDVDERSITEVSPDDLTRYTQCHFFAGIGVWSYALRRAGWADDAPVWTGSCPCQPFSASGKRRGTDDERHLWPAWFRLLRECRPDVVFGEQVASKAGLGWLDIVSADLEGAGYAVGACDFPAASVGAPHIRQRLYFVGERLSGMGHAGRDAGTEAERDRAEGEREGLHARRPDAHRSGATGIVADSQRDRTSIHAKARKPHSKWDSPTSIVADSGGDGIREYARELPSDESEHGERPTNGNHASVASGAVGGVAEPHGSGLRVSGTARLHDHREPGDDAHGCREAGVAGVELGDASLARLQGSEQRGTRHDQRHGPDAHGSVSESDGAFGRLANTDAPEQGCGQLGLHPEDRGRDGNPGLGEREAAGRDRTFWSDAEWIPCRDGKARPVEPGTQPLVAGSAERMVRGGDPSAPIDANNTPEARVMRLRGYGNSIVAPVAEAFIRAYLDAVSER